ncbi:MAG: ABC transporter ATP-binding protein [Peptoniphilaceae bacterium]|nr:ABC transporter ATP-binding protein [Peptoniphilaceae bacterium]MDY6019136.1 ABC transporter ATP-binding protein [Anaerococcus sp.]
MLLEVKNLKKIYKTRFSTVEVQALKDINFSVEDGEFLAIMGESGSGKTTLLNLIALLDKPSSGSIILEGGDVLKINDKEISSFRRDHLGFVFQNFNLLDTFNVKDNIALPLVLKELAYKQIEKRVEYIANLVNIGDLLEKYPYEISGGQKQRVAISRALVNKPKLILADEPTGALDSNSSNELLEVFKDINNNGQTIIMVTHSVRAAAEASRVLFIKDGKIYHQLYKANNTSIEMQEKISQTMTMLQRS